jgi:hypothetical protein
MRAVASILSIIVFLAFATTGLQKLIFNTMASQASEHLGFSKSAFQRVGVLEFLGAVGVLVGLAAKHGTWLALVNEVAAGALALLMVAATAVHLRKGDGLKGSAPAWGLGLLCVLELVLRLV